MAISLKLFDYPVHCSCNLGLTFHLVNVERIKKSNFHCLIAALVEPKNKINYQQKIMKKKSTKKTFSQNFIFAYLGN
jgi:hypothetical protein